VGVRIISDSVSETLRIGRVIAKSLNPGECVCLFGELGSGKTVLAKGVAWGLGIPLKRVVSPSFTLIREHKGRIPFYHFDLYRLKDPQDVLRLGYEEYLCGDGLTLIEWADRLKYLLPRDFLKIELSVRSETKRQLDISISGSRYKELLKRLHENLKH